VQLTVLETTVSFGKLVSKDRFPKLKDFAPQMHYRCLETHMCVKVHFLR